MRIRSDTDILLDFAVGREPFASASRTVIAWAEANPGHAAGAWHTLSNIAYLAPSGQNLRVVPEWIAHPDLPILPSVTQIFAVYDPGAHRLRGGKESTVPIGELPSLTCFDPKLDERGIDRQAGKNLELLDPFCRGRRRHGHLDLTRDRDVELLKYLSGQAEILAADQVPDGRYDEACKAAEETLEQNSEDIFAVMVTAFRHALLGERVSLLAVLEGPGRSYLWNDPEAPEWAAGWLALVDEKDKALDWLDHWIDRGSINHPMLARGDLLLEGIRREARFQRLLDRIRPEWERFTPRFQ